MNVDQEVTRQPWLSPLAWKNAAYYGSKWSEAVDVSFFLATGDDLKGELGNYTGAPNRKFWEKDLKTI